MDKSRFIKNVKKWSVILAQALVITGITVFSVAPVSCKVTTSGIEIVGGDYSAPILQDVTVIDEKTVVLDFSEEVNLTSAVVSPVFVDISDSNDHSESNILSPALYAATGNYGKLDWELVASENKQSLTFNIKGGTETGKQYEILGVVKDRIGNSLTFTVPFTGYNNNIPKIIMTELHTGMSSQTKAEKEKNIRRLEYIEFLALSEGNLVGLEVCSGAYGESKKYCFPSIQVKAGEYFVLHLRDWGDGCISEEEDNLSLAYSEYTQDNIRDLWINESSKIIGDKTDIVVVRNCVTGKLVDAIMYKEEAVGVWEDKLKTVYSNEESLLDIYSDGGNIDNAVDTTSLTASYALQRVGKEEIYNSVLAGEEIDYPVIVNKDSWKIVKPSLPLKQ